MEPREPPADRGGGRPLTARLPARLAALAGAAALAALSWRCGDAGGPASPDPVEVAAATITAADVGTWIAALADDSMRGRQTPSPEIERAAATIARHFAAAGLRPLFGLSWTQDYPVPKSATGELAPNVGAWREGRDTQVRDEYVLYVAHMDHVGVGTPVGGDSIYNGADDNASGTSALLEIAEALAALDPAPRRSMIVLLVSGEEHGFWGSQYFVNTPPVPIGSIVAVFNLDMVSRNQPDTMRVAGMSVSTLGDAVAAAAAAHPEDHLAVRDGPDGLSDHIPFAAEGVPWLLFFAGLHADYHRPSDEPPNSDPDKAARVARLAFRTGVAVANAPGRPVPRTVP